MKMNGSFILKLVFGLMGTIYTAVGGGFLVAAVKAAGDIRRIFTLPEEELAFAINGVVFTSLGVIFLLVAVILILVGRRKKRMREELLIWGTRVTGTITQVRVNRSIRVNGRHPLLAQVQCAFPSGEVTLTSPHLWNACPATGDQVEVIYDPMDERKYVIEISDEK